MANALENTSHVHRGKRRPNSRRRERAAERDGSFLRRRRRRADDVTMSGLDTRQDHVDPQSEDHVSHEEPTDAWGRAGDLPGCDR